MASLSPPGSWPTIGELGTAIWRTQRAIERAVDAWLAPLELPTPVFRILRQLEHEAGQSAADLARKLGLAPQSISLAIDQAERLGLVERRPHPVHGRVRQLFPTQAGHATYQRAASVIRALESELGRSLDDESRAQLWHQLRDLTDQANSLTSRETDSSGDRDTRRERRDIS